MVAVTQRRSFATPRPSSRTRCADDPAAFNFDAQTLALVRRLYVARYADMVRGAGIDTEDGYQLVVEGLLRRARSPRSRWDPSRGAVSTWITVAARGIVLNAIDKHVRAERRNGSLGTEGDAADMADAEGTDMITIAETETEDAPPCVVVRRPALRAVSPTVAPAASAVPAAAPEPPAPVAAPAPPAPAAVVAVLPSTLLGRGDTELRAAGEYLVGGGVTPDRAADELAGVLAWATGVAADNPVARLLARLAVPR